MEEKKPLFGKGIYGKKDAPIKVLDFFIGGMIALIIIFVLVFAWDGGFVIAFDSNGGTDIESQKLEYGDYVVEPLDVSKPGYELEAWVTSEDETLAEVWDFSVDTVYEDMTLVACWTPATITVKFDLDGGSFLDDQEDEFVVVYNSAYGELPEVEKEGYIFDYWVYSGDVITEDSIVGATGEHVLTACWIEE